MSKQDPEKKKSSQAKRSGSKGRGDDPQDLDLEEVEDEVALEEDEESGLDVPDVPDDDEEEQETSPAPVASPQAKKIGPRELSGSEPPEFQERFSSRARTVFAAAKALAGKLGHDAATTGHLIAAILSEEEGIAQDIFSDVNAFPNMFEGEMAGIKKIPAPSSGHWFDAGVELAVKRGLDAAEALERPEVDPEHLLLGLLSIPDGSAAQIMCEFSLSRVDMRDEILAALGADVATFPDWERGKNLRRRPRRG